MSLHVPLARLRPRDNLFYVSRDRTVLATARDGFIHGDGEQGLYVCQTRVLSMYRYRIDGRTPEAVGVSNIEEHSQIGYYVTESPNPDRELFRGALGPGGRAATESIELRLSRFAGNGLAEEVELKNHTRKTASFTLELEIDADFAGATESQGERRQHGQIERDWCSDGNAGELAWTYDAEHDYDHQGHKGKQRLHWSAAARFLPSGAAPVYDREKKCVAFPIELPPHGSWHCSVLVSAHIHGRHYEPVRPDRGFGSLTAHQEEQNRFLSDAARVESSAPALSFVVHRALQQARRDLISLRLYDLDRNDGWTMAAGLPVYISLFGRDTLTTSWQASMLTDRMMRGTLAELAATQATTWDDWHDAQPGRFVHQMETGPVATLKYNPHSQYYGSLTGPGFYPVVVSNLWHWTGDREVIRKFIGPALKGMAWLDGESKQDQGFYAYKMRSEQGVKNQAWKDSYDAIVYPDGSQVPAPIAPTEFQAFAFASKVRLSELLWWLDEKEQSRKFFDEAMTLRDRFNETFWMEDEGCFGMGLDGAGKLIRSVGSESMHAVAAGIVGQDRAARTVDRMFRRDLFSGWGVRTLSSEHAAFNPFSYHRGSVWPAEQAAFCMGLMRYGMHDWLHQLTKAQFEAAAVFEYCRLPELFSGHQRDECQPIPALYPHADSPQAWSASGVWCMLQALLGIFPYAPMHTLFVDPQLPEWLPEIELRNLHVGGATVDLQFRRGENGSSDYRVLDVRGNLRVIRQASPWSLTTNFGERLVDAISSVLPGH